MAQYLGILQGQRGEVTRLGSKGSGLRVVANGWDAGVKVNAHNETDDTGKSIDVFVIEVTGGSNAASPRQVIAIIRNGVVESRMPQPEPIPHACLCHCPTCGKGIDEANIMVDGSQSCLSCIA